jgi:hypothetical protein
MTPRRQGIGTIFVVIIVVVVMVIGTIGFVMYNSSSAPLPTASSSTSSTIVSTTSMSVVTLGPQPLAGELSGQNASCSLESGVCTFTVVNNSTASLELLGCQMQVIGSEVTSTTFSAAGSESTITTYVTFANGSISTSVSTPTNYNASASAIIQTITEYLDINGTIGGPATAGIPASSQVTMTCTFPTTQLTQQPTGSQASGVVWVKLASSGDSYPAGTQTGFSFGGVWS